MDNIDTAQLIYLSLLGGAIAFWFLVANRGQMGKVLQGAVMWGLIFIAVIAAYGLWGDIQTTVQPRQTVSTETGQIILPRGAGGHYFLEAEVNGTPMRFVVDTGATHVVLSQEDAARIGFDPDALTYFGTAQTANGIVRTAPVEIDTITIGDLTDRGVRAVVNEGDLFESLLGMSYLERFSNIQIANDRLILTR
ncbi:MAG: TIGR02281 family clan AA aspartic protease [Roseovarius sp.]